MRPIAHPERFNLRLAPEELRMLNDLATAIGVTASDVVRMFVREKHAERFGAPAVQPAPRRTPPRGKGK